jgi:hypothetical protein
MQLGRSELGAIALAMAMTSLASCGPSGSPQDKSDRVLDGYAGLKLGSTFEEAMLVADPSDFNPFGMKECLEDMPIKGCFLSPESDLTTFRRVQGIPYGLQLEFNRLGALTDITLRFTRSRTYDDDLNPVPATITKSECSSVVERTIDWVSSEYGNLASKQAKGSDSQPAKTAKGNAYWQNKSTDGSGFFASGHVEFKDSRLVGLFAHFLLLDGEPNCSISVLFKEASKIERRVSDSDTKAESEPFVEKAARPQAQAQAKRRYPYVTPDGVDITNAEDERNWRKYGTTDPNGGE